jgi:hypothetical protein
MIRRQAALLLATLAVVAVACQDLASPQAYATTVADTLKASALNGTPFGARSALNVAIPDVYAPDGSLNYDIVFDINDAGKAVLIPVSKIGLCQRVCQVGLQVVGDSSFDQLTKARTKGYGYDTTLTINTGVPVLIVAKSASCATDLYSNDLYAKLIVDSVRTSDRVVFFRIVTDPNCGFRGLVPGETPKN